MALFALLTLFVSAVLAQSPPGTTQYFVQNNCPTAINLYIGGTFDSTLQKGATTTKFASGFTPGFFYTDANGGNANGAATRAGFFNTNQYYYLVKDPNHFNTGLSIKPRGQTSTNGFCRTATCDDVSCTGAFSQPPTAFPPLSNTTAPAIPLNQCAFPGDSFFDITFCPSGSFPTPAGSQIHPNFNSAKCLDVKGAVFANGTPVQIFDCNGTPAQRWTLNRSSTKVRLAGTNFCLDAGSTPGNGVAMKIWTCFDNLPAQQWFYTTDNRIALEGKGQCLDLDQGITTNGHKVQTWQCTNFNTNQIWTL